MVQTIKLLQDFSALFYNYDNVHTKECKFSHKLFSKTHYLYCHTYHINTCNKNACLFYLRVISIPVYLCCAAVIATILLFVYVSLMQQSPAYTANISTKIQGRSTLTPSTPCTLALRESSIMPFNTSFNCYVVN